jgi:predicted ester cyclase
MTAPVPDPAAVVRRLIDEVMNGGREDVIPEIYDPALAGAAQRWIASFRASFPDMRMEIRDLIVAGEKVVGHFVCSGTHLGPWRGYPPTGRRFRRIDEVYIFRVVDGKIVHAWGIEDTHRRMQHLGLMP